MSQIEFEGKTYCDWRIGIENCEGSEYFKIMYALGEALGAICFPCLIISLAIRKFAFGGELKIIPTGENGFLLLIFPVPIAFTFQFVSVLAHWSDLASGVLWAFCYPFINITMAYYLSFVRKTLPKLVVTQGSSRWQLSGRASSSLLVVFALLVFATHVIVISVAHFFTSTGQLALGKQIEQIGLTITSVSCLILTIGSSYCSISLMRKIQDVLHDSGNIVSKTVDYTFLALMVNKLRQHCVVTITLGTLQIGYFLLLAFYPSFFTNLAFSKAVAFIIIVVHPTSGTFHCLMTTVFDIRKWLYSKQTQEKEKLAKELEKRDGSGSLVRMPSFDRDPVLRVIDGRRSKESL